MRKRSGKQQLSTRSKRQFGSNRVKPGSFSLFAQLFFRLYASRRFLFFSSLCSSVIAAQRARCRLAALFEVQEHQRGDQDLIQWYFVRRVLGTDT